jgi:type II secretory pathway pseudopilin PulG
MFKKLAIGCGGLIALIAVVGIIAVAASGGGGNAGGSDTDQSQSEQQSGQGEGQEQGQRKLTVGQPANVGDAEVTLQGVRRLSHDFLPPDPGFQYVALDFTVVNTGDDEYNLSTLLQFEILDSDSRKYDVTIHPDTQGTLDGTIPTGGTVRGEVVFEVPVDKAPYAARFIQAFGSEMAEWTVQP